MHSRDEGEDEKEDELDDDTRKIGINYLVYAKRLAKKDPEGVKSQK
jgi:hypothetical protein